MGNARGDQEDLGIDTNILVSFLDEEHPDNLKTGKIGEYKLVINPTVVHEAFHTLIYKQKWLHEEARSTLDDFINLSPIKFLNQTKNITKLGLKIGTKYQLKGRDSLILANFLANDIQRLVTFDRELLNVKEVQSNNRTLKIIEIEEL